MLCAGVYDHILMKMGSEHAFSSHPKVLAKALAGLCEENFDRVALLLQERDFPFDASLTENLRNVCTHRGKIPGSLRYSTFEFFMLHVSKWEYFPTKPLKDLLQLANPDARELESIATQVPNADTSSIKKLGNQIFTFTLDNGERAFFHNHGVPMVYPLSTVLRYLHFALKWIMSVEGIVLPFTCKPLSPPRGFAAEMALRLAGSCNGRESWSFVYKTLLPKVLNHLDKIGGIIASIYTTERFSDVSSETDNPCTICLSGLTGSSDTRTLPCGHAFHLGCIARHAIGNSTCPICRREISSVQFPAAIPHLHRVGRLVDM